MGPHTVTSDEGGYGAFFESSSDGMLRCDSEGRIVEVNRSALRLLGCESAALTGRGFEDIFDPIDVRLEPAREEWSGTGRFDGNLLVSRSDGTCFTAEVSVRVGEKGGAVVFRSVGERESFPGAVGGDEPVFRALVNGSPDLVALVEGDGNIRYISPSVERMCGYTPEEVEGKRLFEFVHEEDHAAAMRDLSWTAQNPGTVGLRGPVVRLRHRDEDWITVEAFVSNHMDDPNIGALVFDCRDITERVRLEGELRKSEERFRALIDNAHDFVVLADEDNVFRYASPAIERILGYTPEELIGTTVADLAHPDELPAALASIAEILPLPGPQTHGVWRYRHRDGSYRWLEVVVNNRLDDPNLRGVVCNCRDVTERVESEARRQEIEERFRGLVEHTHDFIALASAENVALYANPSIERIMGYTPEEFVGTFIGQYIHPDDVEAGLANVAGSLASPGPHTLETIRYVHKDGSTVWLEVTVNNQLDNPAVGGVICNCRDVTERVEAEERLRESEERFRALIENAHDFVVLADENNIARYASPAIEQTLGYTPEEFIGTVISGYGHPDEAEAALARIAETIPVSGPQTLGTWRYRHKDGSYRWLEVVVNNRFDDPNLRGAVCNCRDVTERVESEERLREAEERYRLLVEQVPAATYIENNDSDSSTVYVSPRIEEMLGYTPEEWTGEPGLWLRTIHPDDHGRVLARHLRCNETGETFDEEYRCVAKDGREVWLRDEAQMVRGADGEPLYWQGVKTDITGRKLAELEILRLNESLRVEISDYTRELRAAIASLVEAENHLEAREEQLLATFERAAIGIAHVSPEGRWLRVNEKLCSILGYERHELLGRTFQDLTHPEDLDGDLANVRSLLNGETSEYSTEKRYLAKNGTVLWAKLSVSLVRGSGGEPEYFVSIIEDISHRKRAEEILKVLTPRELKVLGEMARGRTNTEIADDLNYSVNTIKTLVRSVTEKLGVSDRTQAAVHAAETGIFAVESRNGERSRSLR